VDTGIYSRPPDARHAAATVLAHTGPPALILSPGVLVPAGAVVTVKGRGRSEWLARLATPGALISGNALPLVQLGLVVEFPGYAEPAQRDTPQATRGLFAILVGVSHLIQPDRRLLALPHEESPGFREIDRENGSPLGHHSR
jgi:hypothetical protein